MPSSGFSMSPSTKTNFFAFAPVMWRRRRRMTPRCRDERTLTTSFVFGWRIFSGRTTETRRSMRRSFAAWARSSLPRKPVAPVTRTCNRGLRPRARSSARASFWSLSMRALTSFSERCEASRNLKKTSRSATPMRRFAPFSTALLPVAEPSASASLSPRRFTFLRPSLTASSLPVHWITRLARYCAVTSMGFLSRWAWTSRSSGSTGRSTSLPVARLTLAM